MRRGYLITSPPLFLRKIKLLKNIDLYGSWEKLYWAHLKIKQNNYIKTNEHIRVAHGVMPVHRRRFLFSVELSRKTTLLNENHILITSLAWLGFGECRHPPLSMEHTFQDPQWMSEATYCAESSIYWVFFFLYLHTYDKVEFISQPISQTEDLYLWS